MSNVTSIDTTLPVDDLAVSKAAFRAQWQEIANLIATNQDELGQPPIGWTLVSNANLTVDADSTRRHILVVDNLSATRTITLPTGGTAFKGPLGHDIDDNAQHAFTYFLARHPAASPSAFDVIVTPIVDPSASGSQRVLGSGDWMTVTYLNGGWHVTGFGSLTESTAGGGGGIELDERNIFTRPQGVAEVTIAYNSSIVWDLGTVQKARTTLTGGTTLSFTGATAGFTYRYVFVQDGTGGRTVSFGSGIEWLGSGAPNTGSMGAGEKILMYFEATGSPSVTLLGTWATT